MIIGIDGPSGAGKSSVAKQIAKQLNISYLDTGAMYRALTVLAINNNIDLTDGEALADLALRNNIVLNSDPNNSGDTKVTIGGIDVTQEIRQADISKNVTPVCKHQKVREILVSYQQEIGKSGSWVVDGRDICTVVFPDAQVKVYLDADVNERARRRYEENLQKGRSSDFDQVLKDMIRRDKEDSTRSCSPLVCAPDAIRIDSTKMSQDQVVDTIINLANRNR